MFSDFKLHILFISSTQCINIQFFKFSALNWLWYKSERPVVALVEYTVTFLETSFHLRNFHNHTRKHFTRHPHTGVSHPPHPHTFTLSCFLRLVLNCIVYGKILFKYTNSDNIFCSNSVKEYLLSLSKKCHL